MVNEYRHTTIPLDRKLQGIQGEGANVSGGPSVGADWKMLAAGGGASCARKYTWSTARHSIPKITRYSPIARKNARHIVSPP